MAPPDDVFHEKATPENAVTRLLRAWRQGDQEALNQLMPLVYDHLRAIAGSYLKAEAPGHTMQATAVVHEAFLRLAGPGALSAVDWQNRIHFIAIAARTMRRILVDHARAARREKRGGGADGRGGSAVPLDDALVIAPEPDARVLDLDEALTRLAALDDRKATVLEMLYFGGLTWAETAAALDVSEATVQRELKFAKAWLRSDLKRKPPA